MLSDRRRYWPWGAESIRWRPMAGRGIRNGGFCGLPWGHSTCGSHRNGEGRTDYHPEEVVAKIAELDSSLAAVVVTHDPALTFEVNVARRLDMAFP